VYEYLLSIGGSFSSAFLREIEAWCRMLSIFCRVRSLFLVIFTSMVFVPVAHFAILFARSRGVEKRFLVVANLQRRLLIDLSIVYH
jgi:hypothetical protein